MYRTVLSCVNRRWHQRCTRSLSVAQNAMSLALTGYSNQQLKLTKGRMKTGATPVVNLGWDESVLLLNNSVKRKFDPLLLCRATLFSDEGTRFPASASAAVVTSIQKSGTKEDLKNFRSLLCNDLYSSKFEFDAKAIQQAIDQCLSWGAPDEALQWLMFAQDRLQLVPTNHSFNQLLKAAALSKSWDVLFYLLAEMDSHNIFVNTAMREELIEQASLAPFARWRYTRDSLLKSGAVREPNKPAGSSTFAKTAGRLNVRHHLPPHSLATALWTLARAGEVAAVRELYRTLAADLLRWSEANNFSAITPGTTLPLFSSDALASLGFTAVELQDGVLLQEILSNNLRDCLSAPLPAALARPYRDAGELSHWVEDYVTVLLDAQPLQAEAGRQIGVVVSWLLGCNEPDLAVQIWNRHVFSLRMYAQMSLDDESGRTRAATDATITVISRISAQSQSAELLPAAARFLRAVLVPGPTVTSTQPVPVEVSAASMDMVQDLLDVLARAQDAESAALVLSSALKQGLLVPEDAMSTSLLLLQKEGDHGLVLELFDLYLNIADVRSPGSLKASTTSHSNSTTLSPYIFNVPICSYAKLSSVKNILHFLNTEVPTRGYIPRKGLVAQAMQALLEQGAHEEALSVYKQTQKLYTDLAKRSARGLRVVAPGYGVAQLQLVDLALRCCARGKLGLDALEIFSALEEAQGKGVVNFKPGDFVPLIRSVIEALATAEYVKIVPQFLNSLGGLNAPVVATPEVLGLSLAAAVYTNDEDVAREVGRIARGNDGIGEISGQQLTGVLSESFGHTDERAAREFLDKCGIVLKD